jgi:hypothetical protein
MKKQNWFLRFLKPLLNERGAIGDAEELPEVGLEINAGLTEDKEADPAEDVKDVDDMLNGEKDEKDEKTPADKGEEKEVEDPKLKTMEQRLTRLEEDKKNLKIALHKERQEKKAAKAAPDDPVLTDEQLEKILEENPDSATQLKVVRYMAEKIAKGERKTAIEDVNAGQRSREMNKLLLDRYPDLADEGSAMRVEIEETKENLGISDHPYGDFFAVGARVLENLPTILTNAYEKGKKEALGEKAELKRGEKINGGKLTPGGKKTAPSGVEGLTKEQNESATQMAMTPSQRKIYAQLVGKNTKTVSVEG